MMIVASNCDRRIRVPNGALLACGACVDLGLERAHDGYTVLVGPSRDKDPKFSALDVSENTLFPLSRWLGGPYHLPANAELGVEIATRGKDVTVKYTQENLNDVLKLLEGRERNDS